MAAAPEVSKTTDSDPNLFDQFLSRAGARDRLSIEKHLSFCDAEADPQHGGLWRRLAGALGALAPLPVRLIGPQAVLFFVQDGKYRMQVFAIEDHRDGSILVYLPDVMDQALRERILSKKNGEICTAGNQPIEAESVTRTSMPDPPEHVKHMTGWNRKAMRIRLSAHKSNSPQVEATETLCALAARSWSVAT